MLYALSLVSCRIQKGIRITRENIKLQNQKSIVLACATIRGIWSHFQTCIPAPCTWYFRWWTRHSKATLSFKKASSYLFNGLIDKGQCALHRNLSTQPETVKRCCCSGLIGCYLYYGSFYIYAATLTAVSHQKYAIWLCELKIAFSFIISFWEQPFFFFAQHNFDMTKLTRFGKS